MRKALFFCQNDPPQRSAQTGRMKAESGKTCRKSGKNRADDYARRTAVRKRAATVCQFDKQPPPEIEAESTAAHGKCI